MIHYTLATADDDPWLCALLREHPMQGWVRISLTRDPSFFTGCNRFGSEWAMLARDGDRPVGLYTCAEHPVHLDGNTAEPGYLGGLRIVKTHRNRLSAVRAGYASIRKLHSQPASSIWYSAIATDNRPARRLLEARLRGMPIYTPINEFVTLALPAARARHHGLWQTVPEAELDTLCHFYNTQARRYQFSPVLTPERALRTGARFYAASAGGKMQACMAIWNQMSYKQVCIHGYHRLLHTLLPLYNLLARLTRRVRLPAPGRTLEQSFLAFFAVDTPEQNPVPVTLIEDALSLCDTQILTLGLHAAHPWLAQLQRSFRPLHYRSCIYLVSFEEPGSLRDYPAQPEAALL
ncbi:MAG: hypothetical protein LBQ81_07895 [Zoogloeaceae bacterium]|jgi:hypothetical protein|nr:hypothetical protein [Zoogloeaceae bacterium]